MEDPLSEHPIEVAESEKSMEVISGALEIPKVLPEVYGDSVGEEEVAVENSKILNVTSVETSSLEPSSADVLEPDGHLGGVAESPEDATTGDQAPSSQQGEEKDQIACEELQIPPPEDATTLSMAGTEETEAAGVIIISEEASQDDMEGEIDASPEDLPEGDTSSSANALLVSQEASNVGSCGDDRVESIGNISEHAAYTIDTEQKTSVTSPVAVEPNELNKKEKMKLKVVNSDGKFTFKVTGGDKTVKSQESSKSSAATTPTPREKSKVKRTESGDRATPQRTKSSGQPIGGGKQRNKVMKPITPKSAPSQTLPHKPLMDLRHILKKHQKKTDAVVQPIQQVDFYGSMSAIPFLKKTKPEEKKKKTKKLQPSMATDDNDEIEAPNDKQQDDVLVPEKQKLPTREEITVTPLYDEAQLHLWKSMSALDNQLDSVARPQESLPLRPGIRRKPKKEPSKNSVRAFSRPEDWINRPELQSPTKGYRLASPQQPLDEVDILVMEPEDSLDGHLPPPPFDQGNASLEMA